MTHPTNSATRYALPQSALSSDLQSRKQLLRRLLRQVQDDRAGKLGEREQAVELRNAELSTRIGDVQRNELLSHDRARNTASAMRAALDRLGVKSVKIHADVYLSEAAYHHPDLAVTWGRVTVKLSTHSAGGITDKDFELARKIEEAALWRPSGGALEGTPNKFVRSGDPR